MTTREEIAAQVGALIGRLAYCDTRWPATARIEQDKALEFADAILALSPPEPTEKVIEACARALNPAAFATREEVIASDDMCTCAECQQSRELEQEIARSSARTVLGAARAMPLQDGSKS